MALQDVPAFKLASAQLTRIGGRDAAFVALVAHQGGLMQVGPTAALAGVLVGHRVPAVVGPVLQVETGEGGEGVVQGGEHGTGAL